MADDHHFMEEDAHLKVQSAPSQTSSERMEPLESAKKTLNGARRVAVNNRRQKFFFVLFTILATIAIVAIVRFLAQPSTLTIAVSPKDGVEMGFAVRLAALVRQSHAHLAVKIIAEDTPGQALADFAQGKADLTIARSDQRLPSSARAVAILDRYVLLPIVPKGSKLKHIDALKGKHVAIITVDPRDSPLVRAVLKIYELPQTAIVEEFPLADLPNLFAHPTNAPTLALGVARRSRLRNSVILRDMARKPGFELFDFGDVKAVEGRLNSLKTDTIEAGLLSVTPSVPSDDVDTVGVDELLLARAKTSTPAIADLTRLILENKDQLAEEDMYATAIQPPDTDKDARIVAHRGALEYVNDDMKSFIERYSDYFYIGISVMSGVGTLCVGLYTMLTRASPVKAGELTDEVLDVATRIRTATSLEQVDAAELALDNILIDTLAGMRDGGVSNEGFDGFRLAFECALGAAAAKRAALGEKPSASAEASAPTSLTPEPSDGGAESDDACVVV